MVSNQQQFDMSILMRVIFFALKPCTSLCNDLELMKHFETLKQLLLLLQLHVICLPRFWWRRNGKFFNVEKDPRVSMKKRSGTLEISFRNGGKPEDYEGEYQCFAMNDFGTAISKKILLRVSSK